MIRSLAQGQKPALIINELQIGLLQEDIAVFPALARIAKKRDIVANVARLAAAFRAAGHPVFYTPVVNRPDAQGRKINSLIAAHSAKQNGMIAGTPSTLHPEAITPHPGDFVIDRGGGFIAMLGTTLDATLRRIGIETLVITGISTNIAIPGNTIVAVEYGYHVVIPEDCIAAADEQAHSVIVEKQLRMLATITDSSAVIAAIA